MIPVFICASDSTQRENIKRIVEDYIVIEDLDMKVTAFADSQAVVDLLITRPFQNGVYFLDIDLSDKTNGITIASKIREFDNRGTIVLITKHPELMYLTFEYKLEVMDFITKGNPLEVSKRICECMKVVYERTLKQGKNIDNLFYQVKIDKKIKLIPYEEIMFFETSLTPHMLILHLADTQFEFRGSIKDVATDKRFFRCHKSIVVNLDNVRAIRISERYLEMVNGSSCSFSARALKELKAISFIVNSA